MTLPLYVENICKHLIKHKCKPIIVGGYVRDSLLNIPSKDIDIEVFDVEDLETLQLLLQEFGSINRVGRSFGVLKLSTSSLEIDFSLPRQEIKVAQGHKGFEITTNRHLDFASAAFRRDFRMNAMGYDLQTETLLDPYQGQQDLSDKVLRCVNPHSFVEDPLRILRAMQFGARLALNLDEELQLLIIKMLHENALDELPQERIFEELKKLLLKAEKPSLGFVLMQKTNVLLFFPTLYKLSKKDFLLTIKALDKLATLPKKGHKKHLVYALTLLTHCFKSNQDVSTFIKSISDDIQLEKNILLLFKYHKIALQLLHNDVSKYDLRVLSTKVCLDDICTLLQARSHQKESERLYQLAKELNILFEPPVPLLLGRHLIEAGLKPSKQFGTLLSEVYQLQLAGEVTNLKEVKIWLKNKIITLS